MTALLLLNLMALGLGVAAWLSPELLDRAGGNAKARAAALRKSRKVYHATFNAMMDRKPAPQRTPSGPSFAALASLRETRLAKAAKAIGAAFGILLIVAAIAALVVMPQ